MVLLPRAGPHVCKLTQGLQGTVDLKMSGFKKFGWNDENKERVTAALGELWESGFCHTVTCGKTGHKVSLYCMVECLGEVAGKRLRDCFPNGPSSPQRAASLAPSAKKRGKVREGSSSSVTNPPPDPERLNDEAARGDHDYLDLPLAPARCCTSGDAEKARVACTTLEQARYRTDAVQASHHGGAGWCGWNCMAHCACMPAKTCMQVTADLYWLASCPDEAGLEGVRNKLQVVGRNQETGLLALMDTPIASSSKSLVVDEIPYTVRIRLLRGLQGPSTATRKGGKVREEQVAAALDEYLEGVRNMLLPYLGLGEEASEAGTESTTDIPATLVQLLQARAQVR